MQKQDLDLMQQILHLHSEGKTDGDITRILKRSHSLIHHYRCYVLKLKANWKKVKYLSEEDRIKGYIIRNLKFSAKRRGIPFDITYEDIHLPTTCPLLGIPLVYSNRTEETLFNNPNHATVDRFDNTKGYIKGNIWILSRLANTMKSSASLDQLETFSLTMLHHLKNHRALGGITDLTSLDP